MSLADVAKIVGLSTSRVKQLEARALRKLRDGLANDPIIRDYLEETKEAT